MDLERLCWGSSLDLLWDSCNGALWLEHCVIINQILFYAFRGGLTSGEGGYTWMYFFVDKVGWPIT